MPPEYNEVPWWVMPTLHRQAFEKLGDYNDSIDWMMRQTFTQGPDGILYWDSDVPASPMKWDPKTAAWIDADEG